jgi:hypothetical protein
MQPILIQMSLLKKPAAMRHNRGWASKKKGRCTAGFEKTAPEKEIA